MLFLGIDLAWSGKNNSGVAVIGGDERSGKLLNAGLALTDEEIIRFVSKASNGNDAHIAIDAPLVVPNQTGRRVAEALVGDLFRKYNAGAHPSNRERLGAWSNGKIRGEEIVKQLEEVGFVHDPFIKKFESSRKVFEVYPHPSMVVLFNLNKVIKYKAKPKRSLEFRVGEFERYEKLLKGLKNPSLKLGTKISEGKLTDMSPAQLKRHEDMLDAVFCAYISYYYWVHPEKCAVLGSMKEGYIMTPVFDDMRRQMKSRNSMLKEFN